MNLEVNDGVITLKGQFSTERNGKTLDCEVILLTDGTIKNENGEAWLRLVAGNNKTCGKIVEIENDSFINLKDK